MCFSIWKVMAFEIDISFCTVIFSMIQVSLLGEGVHDVMAVFKSTQFDGSWEGTHLCFIQSLYLWVHTQRHILLRWKYVMQLHTFKILFHLIFCIIQNNYKFQENESKFSSKSMLFQPFYLSCKILLKNCWWHAKWLQTFYSTNVNINEWKFVLNKWLTIINYFIKTNNNFKGLKFIQSLWSFNKYHIMCQHYISKKF